jgi:hypothetical protein
MNMSAETGTGTFHAAHWVVWDARDPRDNRLCHFCLWREGFEAPMVMLLVKSELSWNGSDAKSHAPGVPVTGARVLRSGHHNAARKSLVSGRDRVSGAEPWERSADTVLRVSRLRRVREGREGSVVDRPDADTRKASFPLYPNSARKCTCPHFSARRGQC